MDFKATLMLCNHAEVPQNGLVYIHGGGWTWCGPGPALHALGILIEVPWHRMNEQLYFSVDLLDEDGGAVGNADREPIRASGNFELGRPAGIKQGTAGIFPLALNFGPIELEPDSRYVWQLAINGQVDDHWKAVFNTRPLPSQN